MIKELEKFPTVDEIKEKYPEPITANENSLRVDEWKDGLPEDKKTYTYIGDDINDAVETEEQYPHCNYCVGGAVQMAFGQMEPSFVDDWELGIFPRVMELAETLHYFCDIPYASKNDDAESFEEFVFDMDKCLFPNHSNRKESCLSEDSETTAYTLATEIIAFNDAGDFKNAWGCVAKALDIKSRGDKNIERKAK